MPGIGVVLNPNSKRYRKNPENLKRMGFIVGERGDCHQTNNHFDIRKVAEEFKRKEIEILALSGGDGTSHQTLTTFFQVYGDQPLPKITFLRGGTFNTIAGGLGIHGEPEFILTNLLYKYHEGEPFVETRADIMNINGKYGFIWGMGVVHRFMENYYRGIPSHGQAIWTLAQMIGSAAVNGPLACRLFERFDGEVRVNGQLWPFRNYCAIFAGSVRYLGFGSQVFHFAGPPETFHAIGLSLPPRGVLRHVPRMFLGRPARSPDILEEPAYEMTVKLEEPKGFIIDGEMHPPTDQFVVRSGPRLTVLVG